MIAAVVVVVIAVVLASLAWEWARLRSFERWVKSALKEDGTND